MHIKNKSQYFAVLTFDNYVKFIDFPCFTLFHFWFLSYENRPLSALTNNDTVATVHFLYFFEILKTHKLIHRNFFIFND